MPTLYLSAHFQLSEFTRSQTATTRGIANVPTLEHVANLQALCIKVLEPVRTDINAPIVIGSGYRCPQLNNLVGGVKNSQHMCGQACDLHIRNEEEGNRIFDYIAKNLVFDQLIRERNNANSKSWWIHVSYKANGGNRMQIISNLIKNK